MERGGAPDAVSVEVQKAIADAPRFAQNGPGASNGSKRDAIDQIARDVAASGGDHYKYVPNTGTATCSRFVNDVTDEAGARMRVKDRQTGEMRRPTAGEIATQKIRGWRKLGQGEKPLPGDIAAYSSVGFRDFTGHCGIVTSDGRGGVTSTSAHSYGVYSGRDHFFDENAEVTFQRYVGN